jgi:hypothetical protein
LILIFIDFLFHSMCSGNKSFLVIVKSVILTFLVRKSAKKLILKDFLNSSKLRPRLPGSYRHTQANHQYIYFLGSGSEMDLDKDLHPLGRSMNDLDDSGLQNLDRDEIKSLCLIQLEGMSKIIVNSLQFFSNFGQFLSIFGQILSIIDQFLSNSSLIIAQFFCSMRWLRFPIHL